LFVAHVFEQRAFFGSSDGADLGPDGLMALSPNGFSAFARQESQATVVGQAALPVPLA